jgi:sterol desaturase/sphingolipid hydroxylase (fatty acid hydroxylase superfamily)
MYLGKVGYYADFVIYPILLLGAALVAMTYALPMQRVEWSLAALLGLVAWTLLEYLMHRFVLHHITYFGRMHEVHHHAPTAKIGTPTWASLMFIAVVILLPACAALGLFLGSGATVGVVIGYYWYICVHHAVHHWRLDHDTYLYRAKRRHAQHHHTHESHYFGVTTPLWDYILGSALHPFWSRIVRAAR